MKFIFTLLFSAFLLPVATAQSGQWLWGRSNTGSGVDAYAVATDIWGNVYGGGFNYEGIPATFGTVTVPHLPIGSGSQAIWVKYDSSGTVLWADGTQNGDAVLYNMATDLYGDLIVFGSFDSPALTIGATTLTNIYGSLDNQYFLAKYSPTGALLWAISDGNVSGDYGSVGPGVISGGGVVTDSYGNIYITSSFRKTAISIGSYTLTNADASSGLTEDVFIAKYDPSGALAWASSIGGTSNDYACGITVVPSGNIYISGSFSSPSVTVGTSVITDSFVSSGGAGVSSGAARAYIAEFSPAGTPLWAEAAGGSNGAYAVGLASDPYGNIYMTGGFGDTSISFGAATVRRTYPDAVPFLALYLVQYSPGNVATWSKTIGSTANQVYGFSIGLSGCGEVWVSGEYSQDVNIDDHILSLVSGNDPIFIAGYTLAGGVISYSGLGSGGDDQNSIAVDPKGNVFICSDWYGAPAFVLGPDTFSGGSTGTELFYVGKYSSVLGVADTGFIQQHAYLCNSLNSVISAPGGYSNYYWANGDTTQKLNIAQPGTYVVYCSSTCSIPVLADTFIVQSLSSPGPFYLGPDTTLCAGSQYTITSGVNSTVWSTGDTAANITVSKTGVYIATMSNICGSISDSVKADFNNSCFIWLPNAFTPNNDGRNDIIRVGGQLALFRNFSFSIFNRWGQRVFYTQDIYAGWDGMFNGVPQEIGTYFYLINYDLVGQPHIMKGDFELIR